MCDRWVKLEHSETSSKMRLPYLNIWICMRFQISKYFFFQIYKWCLFSCHMLCKYLTINSSQKLSSTHSFHILFRYNFLSSSTGSTRLVWSWVFERSLMNKATRERPNNPVRHQQCLKPIKVSFSPGIVSHSHSHCLVLFWSRLSPQQLFGWSVIFAAKGDSWIIIYFQER